MSQESGVVDSKQLSPKFLRLPQKDLDLMQALVTLGKFQSVAAIVRNGLAEYLGRYMSHLPSGEAQKVEALALLLSEAGKQKKEDTEHE